jgi:hypothetical protein
LLSIGQAVGCIDLARFNIQTHAGTGNQVAVDPVSGLLQLRIIPAKPLAVPQVNASLILELNVHIEVVEQMPSGLDDLILGFPRQIIIEVKDVVILHSPRWRSL